jgi:hypothetical protein
MMIFVSPSLRPMPTARPDAFGNLTTVRLPSVVGLLLSNPHRGELWVSEHRHGHSPPS